MASTGHIGASLQIRAAPARALYVLILCMYRVSGSRESVLCKLVIPARFAERFLSRGCVFGLNAEAESARQVEHRNPSRVFFLEPSTHLESMSDANCQRIQTVLILRHL